MENLDINVKMNKGVIRSLKFFYGVHFLKSLTTTSLYGIFAGVEFKDRTEAAKNDLQSSTPEYFPHQFEVP